MSRFTTRTALYSLLGMIAGLLIVVGSQASLQSDALAAVNAEPAAQTSATLPPQATKYALAVNGTPVAQRTPASTTTNVQGLQPGDTVTFELHYTVSGTPSPPQPPGSVVLHDFLNANFSVLSAPNCVNRGSAGSNYSTLPPGVAPNATVLDCQAPNPNPDGASTTILARVVPGAPISSPPPADDPAGNVACPVGGGDPFHNCGAVRLSIGTPTMPTATNTLVPTITLQPATGTPTLVPTIQPATRTPTPTATRAIIPTPVPSGDAAATRGIGQVRIASHPGTADFAFFVRRFPNVALIGTLFYNDVDRGLRLSSTSIDSLEIVDDQATIRGQCVRYGTVCTFVARATSNANGDQFLITIDGEAHAEGGRLLRGNVVVRDPNP